jgi:hypothetical protein
VNYSSVQPTLTSTCNAATGESIYVYDSGNPSDTTGAVGGLWSAGASHRIPSVSTTGSGTALTTSIEAYGINGGIGSALTGTFNVQAPYNSGTTNVVGGFLKNSNTLFASSPGPVMIGTAVLTLANSILPFTPPGIYADTITFIAVGSF